MSKGNIVLKIYDYDGEELLQCPVDFSIYLEIKYNRHTFRLIPLYDRIFDIQIDYNYNPTVFNMHEAVKYNNKSFELKDMLFYSPNNSYITECDFNNYPSSDYKVLVYYIEDKGAEFYRRNGRNYSSIYTRNNKDFHNLKVLTLETFIKEFYNFDLIGCNDSVHFSIQHEDKAITNNNRGYNIWFKNRENFEYNFNIGIDTLNKVLDTFSDFNIAISSGHPFIPGNHFGDTKLSDHILWIDNEHPSERCYVARILSQDRKTEIIVAFINDKLAALDFSLNNMISTNLKIDSIDINSVLSMSRLIGINKLNKNINVYGNLIQLEDLSEEQGELVIKETVVNMA